MKRNEAKATGLAVEILAIRRVAIDNIFLILIYAKPKTVINRVISIYCEDSQLVVKLFFNVSINRLK